MQIPVSKIGSELILSFIHAVQRVLTWQAEDRILSFVLEPVFEAVLRTGQYAR